MSHLSKIFEEAPIRVQNRNGFDLSHVHAGTSKTGQLVPVLTKLIVPNSTISLGVNAEVNLPPLVAPFYGKVDFAIEGFVVPLSILYGGFKQFISNQEVTQFPVTQSAITSNYSAETIVSAGTTTGRGISSITDKQGYALPYFDLAAADISDLASFTTLKLKNENVYSYMGMNIRNITGSGFPVSLLPALAYHKICDVFYRNTKLTRTWFSVNPNIGFVQSASNTGAAYGLNTKNVSLIWHSFYTSSQLGTVGSGPDSTTSKFEYNAELTFPDGVSIFSTRQRTYARDYFTSAVPSPQQGGASVLKFAVDTTDAEGAFTINSLRAANALQKFLETNNLSGEYAEMLRNRWGIRPIDADFDEPHYLGRVVIPVYQHTIAMTNQQEQAYAPSMQNTNPFVAAGALGSKAGVAGANGEGSICDNFNVSCWSYLMVLASLVPHANYNYGINRELTMTTLGDFPAPELQTVGMEEIKNYEIMGGLTNVPVTTLTGTWAYTPRFSRVKYCDDHVSGELSPYATMNMYQLQRNFSGATPTLGTDFVTIASNALDDVLAVNTATMNLTCWWEIFFNFKVVMPLSDYCIPTLGELQDTHTIKSTVGGSRL